MGDVLVDGVVFNYEYVGGGEGVWGGWCGCCDGMDFEIGVEGVDDGVEELVGFDGFCEDGGEKVVGGGGGFVVEGGEEDGGEFGVGG